MAASGFHFSRDKPDDQLIGELSSSEKFPDEVIFEIFISYLLI